jgi:hypothetical protein
MEASSPDLVERLAAEVLGLEHLGFAALHELADQADVRVLQAVRRAHRQLELVHRAEQVRVHRLRLLEAGQRRLLALLEVDEDAELVLQDLGAEGHGVRGFERAVGPDLEVEPVEVRIATHAGGRHRVVDAPHRREDRVDRDRADRHVSVLFFSAST